MFPCNIVLMKEKQCLNKNCNKTFLTNGNTKWCGIECRYPPRKCLMDGCLNISTKSSYCSIVCRNRHISILSRTKKNEAQKRPEVRLKKSIGQKMAFDNIETRLKHKEAVKASYVNGRQAWNKGLNLKTVICECCKIEFKINGYKKQRFCSRACRSKVRIKTPVIPNITKTNKRIPWNKGNINKKELQCLQCSKTFESHLSAKRKFCSKECEGDYKSKKTIHTCPECKNDFFAKQNRIYCSKKCSCIANQTVKQEKLKENYGKAERSLVMKRTWEEQKDEILTKRNTQEYLEKLSKIMVVRSRDTWDGKTEEDIHEIVKKTHETKKQNNSYGKSIEEDNIHEMLLEKYKDVQRQYSDEERYPFSCDFYIPSLDLFIEYQGSWTHGKEPYNGANVPDDWVEKSKTSIYYKNAIKVYKESDRLKREFALNNDLNFLELWSLPSKQYLYLQIDRIINGLKYVNSSDKLKNELTWFDSTEGNYNARPRNNKIVLTYQPHFYEKERMLWRSSALQRRLILNRCHHLNKKEEDLLDRELLRGFKISGEHYGFSHFSPLWIKAFIKEFNVQSIYDPCAGWGHRLIGAQNIPYFGNDINEKTCNGLKNIVNDMGLKDKLILNNDASEFIPDFNYDAVFTCPPYHDLEDYWQKLPAYNIWLISFWDKVVKNSIANKPRLFSFVISNRYKDDMNKICINNGIKLIKEIQIGSNNLSHFLRSSDKNYDKKLEFLMIYSCID